MTKNIIIVAGVAAILAIVALTSRTAEEPIVDTIIQTQEEIHLHAGFQVYKSNELQDYSGFEFMKVEPCGLDHGDEIDPEHEQLEKAHLHDGVGDVVHVHRTNATWRDLFTNIKVEVTPSEVYINGELFEGDFLGYEIKPYDSVVIFEGENIDIEAKLSTAVTKDHIVETESKSENCGS